MSKGKLKVYGANTFLIGHQARTIAAVSSQKEFAQLIGTSVNYVRDYASETGNQEEIAVAYRHVGEPVVQCPTCNHWHVWKP